MNKLAKLFIKSFNRFKIYLLNSSWVLLGYFIRLVTVVFIFSKIADLIGKEDFGWYNLGISCFTILFAISTLGFDSSFVVKKLVAHEDEPNEQKKILGTFFFGRIFFTSFLLLLLSAYILMFANDIRYWVLLIASFSALFQAYEIFYYYYQWKLKAQVYVTYEIISVVISSLGFIYGIIKGYGVFFFITIYSIERLVFLFGLMISFHRNVFKIQDLKFNLKDLKHNILLSWPIMLGALLTALYARFDQFLVGSLLSMEELGLYNPSVILSQIWLVVPSLIVPVIYPKIASLKNELNLKRYNELIYTVYGVLNYLAIGVVLFMLLFGKWIIVQLYGNQYLESIPILYILIFEMIILFQSHLTSYILILEDEEKYLFKLKLVGVILNISLNLIFLKIFGLAFAPWSVIISAVISWFAMAPFNKKMRSLVRLNFSSFLLIFRLKDILK